MKYIIFEKDEPVIFSALINHRDMAQMVGKKPVSAGFVHLQDGEFGAGGSSFTLNLDSRPEDTEIIKRQLRYY